MTDLATVRPGRKSFEQRAWAESFRLLQAADRDAPLDTQDLERLAIAAYLFSGMAPVMRARAGRFSRAKEGV